MEAKKFRKVRIGLGIFWGLVCVGFTAVALIEAGRDGESSANLSAVFDKQLHGQDPGAKELTSYDVSFTKYHEGVKADFDSRNLSPGDYLIYSYSFTPAEMHPEMRVSIDGQGFAHNPAQSRIDVTGTGSSTVSFVPLETGLNPKTFTFVSSAIPVTALSSPTDSLLLEVGEEYALNVEALPSDATNRNLAYSSYQPNVVKVDASGLLTAISAGKATIHVTSASNPSVRKDILVTVGHIDSVHFLDQAFSSYPGQEIQIAIKFQRSGEYILSNRMSFNLKDDENVAIRYIGSDDDTFTYGIKYKTDVAEAKNLDLSFVYEGLSANFTGSAQWTVLPKEPFRFLPKEQVLATKSFTYNSAYGQGKPSGGEITFNLAYSEYDKKESYRYVFSPKVEVSDGFALKSATMDKIVIKTVGTPVSGTVYHMDFYPDENDLSLCRRFEFKVAFSDYKKRLTDFELKHLKTVENDGEDAVNVFATNKTYDLSGATFYGNPSGGAPFSSYSLNFVPVSFIEGMNVNTVKSFSSSVPGEALIAITSSYETKMGEKNPITKHAKIRFVDVFPTDIAVTSSLFSGEKIGEIDAEIAPFSRFTLNAKPFALDPHNESRIYIGDAPAVRIDDESILSYNETSRQFLTIQAGETKVTLSLPSGPSFVLSLRVSGEFLALPETSTPEIAVLSVFKGNAFAEDLSYCAVGSYFKAIFPLPESLAKQRLVYESSDPEVLSVNAYGTCRALKAGKANVKAYVKDNPSIATSYALTVYDSVGTVSNSPSTYQGRKQSNYVDESQGISCAVATTAIYYVERIVARMEGSAKDVSYSYCKNNLGVDSSSIATVSQDGVVRFHDVGTAIIKVTVGKGSPYAKSFYVGFKVRDTLPTNTSNATRKQFGHFLLFFCIVGTGLLSFFCSPIHDGIRYASLLFMPLYGFGMAYLTEAIQRVTPGRGFSWSDIWLDTQGGLMAALIGVGIYLALFIVKMIRRRKKKIRAE